MLDRVFRDRRRRGSRFVTKPSSYGGGNGACHPLDITFSQPYGGGNGAPPVGVTFSWPYDAGNGAHHLVVSLSQPYGVGNY